MYLPLTYVYGTAGLELFNGTIGYNGAIVSTIS